jgi:hypothetical protein
MELQFEKTIVQGGLSRNNAAKWLGLPHLEAV